jgi:putative transposase
MTGNSSQGEKEGRMPPRRQIADDMTYHLVTRCNNKEHKFTGENHFVKYIVLLRLAKKKFEFNLHSYCLMSNHVHLILKVNKSEELKKIMAWINWRYAIWYNKIHNLTGHFWEERFYSSAILTDRYLLACMRYLDLNPVSAGLAGSQYKWKYSSFKLYADSFRSDLIDMPETYIELGTDEEQRREAYLGLIPAEVKNTKLT